MFPHIVCLHTAQEAEALFRESLNRFMNEDVLNRPAASQTMGALAGALLTQNKHSEAQQILHSAMQLQVLHCTLRNYFSTVVCTSHKNVMNSRAEVYMLLVHACVPVLAYTTYKSSRSLLQASIVHTRYQAYTHKPLHVVTCSTSCLTLGISFMQL
jgi:hypothetical protein